IDEDLAHAILDIASRSEPLLAEVRFEDRIWRSISIRAGQVNSVSSSKDAGMNVRIVLPSGIGFASSNLVSKAEGSKLVKDALSQAKKGKRRSPVALSAESAVRTSWEVRQHKPLADVTVDEKLEHLQSVDSAVMKTGVKVQGRYYELKDWEVSSYFANSEGSRIRSTIPRVKIEAYNLVSSKGETEQSLREWGASGGWEKKDEWNLLEVLPDEVLMLKKQIEKGKRLAPGKYDLICGPEVVGIASHESCGHPMEADRILGREMSQAGKSFVSPDMVGHKVGSEYATVIDDPTVPGTYGYYAYDQEGVKARPRYLYKKGLINEFLQNRETAPRFGVQSNGSSRSEMYLREPIVRMANTFVAPGDFQDDELMGSIKQGVLMHSFTEWNIDDKRFNQKYVSREAYFIRDGELAGPARKCTLEITTPGFWGAIDAVSRKVELSSGECGKGDPMQGMTVTNGGPMIRLREVSLR
ncbi:MAG TPA: TldD/PmbA family protein, partial [Thermoplasmata archaeon]|nr:TldD/PmbA family protein [Thermoplasmata archaeon]